MSASDNILDEGDDGVHADQVATPAIAAAAESNMPALQNSTSDTISAGYGPKQTMAVERAQRLATLIVQEPHRFALQGDQQLVNVSVDALKSIFDFTVDTEGPAIPFIAETLHSTFPEEQDDVGLLSVGVQKRKRNSNGSTSNALATKYSHSLFEPTPLAELTVEGMQGAQLWEQLELRNSKICKLLDAVIVTENEEQDAEDEDEEEDEGVDGEEEEEDLDHNEDLPLDEAERMHKRQRATHEAEEVTINSLKQLSDAELRSIGLDPSKRDELESFDEEEYSEDDDEDDEDEDEYGYPGASDLSDDDEYSGVIATEPLLSEEEQQKRRKEAEAREQRQMRSQQRIARMMQGEHGDDEEDVIDSEDDADDEDEDDEDFDEDQEMLEMEDESASESDDDDDAETKQSNISHLANIINDKFKVRRNAALDDSFFSLDQFNRDTDDYGNEDINLGDEVDLFKNMDREEESEQDQPTYYADFFAPPPFEASEGKDAKKTAKNISSSSADKNVEDKPEENQKKTVRRRSSVRFNEEVSVRRIKARKDKEMQITPELIRLLQQHGQHGDEAAEDDENESSEDPDDIDDADEDHSEEEESESGEEEVEEDEVDEEEDQLGVAGNTDATALDDGASDSDAEQEIARRVAGDLFADDEDDDDQMDDDPNNRVSSHQRRLNALQEEIAQLERENVGKKDWTLMGEAGSRVRPENSLLEEDVEFESNRKAKPVNTPEATQTLEDLIKKRILEDNFDDVQRRANLQPTDFLPSRMLELSDSKSSKSLDQIYEEEMNGTSDGGQGALLDKELQKEHEEIDELYNQLENQLDALSNAHFTPKAPKVTIKTISNAPTISLEESLPTTMSNGAQLAPEEVYDAGAHNVALEGASSELTPEEKRRRHRQLRDEKRTRNERIAEHKRNVEVHREAFGQHRGGRFVGAPAGSGGQQNGKRAAAEKEEALRKLMGNKGVSVVGKGEKATAGTVRRQQNGAARAGASQTSNASHLKL